MPNAPAVIEPDDVADDEWNRMDPAVSSPLVAWLASDEAEHVTGQVIRAVAENIIWMKGWTDGPTLSTTAASAGTPRSSARSSPPTSSRPAPPACATDVGRGQTSAVTTIGQLLAERLGALGITRVWGEAVPGLPLEAVVLDDPDLAVLLADAEGRLGNGLGLAAVPGRVLHLSSKPGGTAAPRTVRGVDDLLDATAGLDLLTLPATVALHLDLDLDAPVPDGSLVEPELEQRVVMTLDPSLADLRGLIVAGPGVVRSGSTRASPRSPRPPGGAWSTPGGRRACSRGTTRSTSAPQACRPRRRRAARAVGPRPGDRHGARSRRVPVGALGDALVQEIEPWQLEALTFRWTTTATPPEAEPALFTELSAVVSPMYESESVPLAPARAALTCPAHVPRAGWWSPIRAWPGSGSHARSPPVTSARSWCPRRPAGVRGGGRARRRRAGSAVRRSGGRTDGRGVADRGRGGGRVGDPDRGAGVGIGRRGPRRRRARPVSEAQFGGERGIVEVPIRLRDLEVLADVAGPVTAWGGLGGEGDES